MNWNLLIVLYTITFNCSIYQAHGQDNDINIKIINNAYVIDSSNITTVSFELQNFSQEEVLVWIEKENVKNLSLKEKTIMYFFKQKGDFSLVQLVGENLT